jgi:preprotein translocase subunit SecG
MANIVLTVHLILALALIGIVLMQRSEGGGLGIGGGGGGMSGRGAATALSKVTWALAIGFLITSLSLTILATRNAGLDSAIERQGIPTGDDSPTVPLPPSLQGPLTPPVDGPATPPTGN